MLQNDTIAAISTPFAVGGIGLIRVSGSNAKDVVNKIFRPISKRNIYNVDGYSGIYGNIFSSDGDIDEVIVFVYNSPRSYTGEDIVEISCHGGLYITKSILRLCLDNGARLAEGGEFTKRAFLNGKLTLTQAEAVMDLISAQGRHANKAALGAKEGAIYKEINDIVQELLNLSGHLAAWADYPEEDIEDVEYKTLEKSLVDIYNKLDELLKGYDVGKVIKGGVNTVIVGKPNVGKSTLMNMLSGTEKSIVTSIAGTTRDIVEDTIKIGEVVLNIADTAGLRDTDDPVESVGVQRANSKLETSSLILAVFDGSQELSQGDIELIDKIKDRPCVAIINKTDLEQKIDIKCIKDNILHVVETSAHVGEGKQQLIDCVNKILNIENIDFSGAIIANERQRSCVIESKQNVKEAIDAVKMLITLDAVNVCIDYAVDSLLSLTGERVTEAVVNQVFSRFCVGK